jgi:hypothetical protein
MVGFVYYESLKRDLKTKTIYGFRCDERLKTKVEKSTRLACTLLCAELEHLMMSGADLLDAPTGTAVVTWSETGQGILGAKEGKGMWVWSALVLAVLSSRMSAGGCSLAGRRDKVPPCLAITLSH